MTRRFAIALLAAFALTTVASSAVLAHPGHEHKILGTVTMAATDHVMLKDKDGKDVTVQVTADTKILQNKKAMKIADVKAGMRVVVSAATEGDKMFALTIELGAATATK